MSPDFEQMVEEILNRSNLNRDELMRRIKQKQDELSGFITPEGAAVIVGKELGIDLVRKEPEVRELRINDLLPGMSGVDVVGRVTRVYEAQDFERVNGSTGRVASLTLQDHSGQIRVVLWDDKAELVEQGQIQKGMAIKIRGGYVKSGLDEKPELNVGARGEITLNPTDPRAEELPPAPETLVAISDLKPDLGEVDLLGRLVASSGPRSFERPDGGQGKVSTLVLADSTGQVRVSLWDERAELVQKLKRGDVVKLENAWVRLGLRDKLELHVGKRGRVILNPQDPRAVDLPPIVERPFKIEEVEADMPSLDLAARVKRKFPPQEFKRDDGTLGKVASVVLVDETGTIRASFWNEATATVERLSVGDVVLIKNAYTRAGLGGRPEVHVGKTAEVQVNPPGIEVKGLEPRPLKLGELEPGMDALEVLGRVIETSGPREFTRADGGKGKVSTLLLGDETGVARASLWGDHAEKVAEIKVGDVVKLTNAYTAVGLQGQPELQLGKQGGLELAPSFDQKLPPADVLKLSLAKPKRVELGSLDREGEMVEVRGAVVQVFKRRPVFDVCPSCGRSLGSVDTSLYCEECGRVVKPEHRAVVSVVLDDGTGNLRAVFFGRAAEKLLGMSSQQVFEAFKEVSAPEEFYRKLKLVGKEVLVAGVTRRDKYFDQLELRVSEVRFPDPKLEARDLLEKVKA